jgi:hypothetical protein
VYSVLINFKVPTILSLITAIYLCFFYTQATLASTSYVAFGDFRGHFEPCGCNPETDLGGFKRLAVFVERERRVHAHLLVLSLGNNLPELTSPKSYQIPYFIQAEQKIAPHATLLNMNELAAISVIAQQALKPNYVLSNQLAESLPKDFKILQHLNIARHTVYGFTYHSSMRKYVEPWSSKLLSKLKKIPSAQTKVLLFSGPLDQLKAIEKSKFFDIIITSNFAPLNKYPDQSESADPSKLLIYQDIYQTPLGGQGILRGGDAQVSKAKSLQELLQQSPASSPVQPIAKALPPQRQIVSWLDKSYDQPSIIEDIISGYNKAGKEQLNVLAKSREDALKTTNFASAQACAQCHTSAHKTWQESHHAKAWKTLKDRDKHEDPSCVSCHVLGFDAKGGFVSEVKSPQFINVQCENCHGPMKDHTQNPTKYKSTIKAKEVCTTCHQPPHTTDFNFDVYWQKIKHTAFP